MSRRAAKRPSRCLRIISQGGKGEKKMERAKRFELSTSTLARWRSTTELRPRTDFLVSVHDPREGGNGAGEEIRTLDIHLGKVALYH